MFIKLLSGLSVVLSLILLTIKLKKQPKKQTDKKNAFDALIGTEYSSYKPYIEAQAKHETGNYTSRVFKDLNNLFGMKHATKRNQLGSDTGDVYRKYSSPHESVEDLIQYLRFVNMPTNFESNADYISGLKKRGYFTDTYSNYLAGTNYHLKNA